jgi:hypothetical protein
VRNRAEEEKRQESMRNDQRDPHVASRLGFASFR